MDGLRQYVISVVAAAIICGIISGLSQKTAAQQGLKLISGLFLVVTVIRPVAKIDLTSLLDLQTSYALEAAEAAAVGERISEDSVREIIKSETETYILEKANELNACIEVEVMVSKGTVPVPVSVSLRGDISSSAKRQLVKMITNELGIPEENQLWTG